MTVREQRAVPASAWLKAALALPDGEAPFPWQERLLKRFLQGRIERSLDLPTGLGKTSVMALWLVARACGASVPRRLAYVVDRRAVVDQATAVAEKLRVAASTDPALSAALGLADGRLAISTLRGQFVDNREWMDDPAAPAIIVGTVDMVGSRLLFEGYGTSRKLRPYQAGLLGNDTLVVLDEAHLVPPFEHLLQAIAKREESLGAAAPDLRRLVPRFSLMALSATGRSASAEPFVLDDEDRAHPEVSRRLGARKRLSMTRLAPGQKLADALAEHAWRISESGTQPVRCLVFCDKRETAESALQALEKHAKGGADTDIFVGGRRVYERQRAAAALETLGFLAGTATQRNRPAFVFATSAAEVGVDMDADHMVCDLVTWERMVQRLGRVNRRGRGDAQVVVLLDEEAIEEIEQRLGVEGALAAPFASLAQRGDAVDVSPGALVRLKEQALEDPALMTVLERATTPEPLRPALTLALIDSWAMTSLEDHSGRPEVAPWLRGWISEEPQTQVIWRSHLPVRSEGPARMHDVAAFFEAAPPHASEVLETATYRVVKWLSERVTELLDRAKARGPDAGGDQSDETENAGASFLEPDEIAAIVLGDDGKPKRMLTLQSLDWRKLERPQATRAREDLERRLTGATLVVRAELGGLERGLLDSAASQIPPTLDGPAEAGEEPEAAGFASGFRVRERTGEDPSGDDGEWHERFRLPVETSPDGEPIRWLIVEKRRTSAENEEDRSSGPPQLLTEHQTWAEQAATELAARLNLPEDYALMLATAARLHDEGKRAHRWQRAFRAPGVGPYAKTRGPIDFGILDGYRHELGSLPLAQKDEQLATLPGELRDLALHLIAAHHGFARPWIGTRSCEDAPPSRIEERAREVALRFIRLHRRWGPWGLAWWEALLRAADQQASKRNEQRSRVRLGSAGDAQEER